MQEEEPIIKPAGIRRKMEFSTAIQEQALRMTLGSSLNGMENLIDIKKYSDLSQEFRDFEVAQAQMVTQDPYMLKEKEKAIKLSDKTVNVLLLGETGTGKELLAQILHGKKHKDQLVNINCAGIPGELFESTLFGHRKGSFTGAVNDAPGRIEMAACGGTVFLDEIGDLPLPQQAKLLRTIEYGEYYRVGESSPRKINCRWIAATNKNIKAMSLTEVQTFRLDLYWRLAGITLRTTPISKRVGDIPLIANMICAQNKWRYLTEAELAQIPYQDGNVREMKAYITHCVMLGYPPDRLEEI